MSTRVTAAADFVTEDGIAVTTASRVLGVSRQAVCERLNPAGYRKITARARRAC